MTGPYPDSKSVTLFVGTKKGLFRMTSRDGRKSWNVEGPFIEGYEVIHVCRSPGNPCAVYAAAAHSVWGAHIYVSRDLGETWSCLEGVPHHPPGRHDSSLRSIWYLAWTPDGTRLYAGIDPAGLFFSDDEGTSWREVSGLNEHPTCDTWEPSRGIFAVHSIHIDPHTPARMYAAVSAGGVYRSEDAGHTWEPANVGVRAENLPQKAPVSGHNVHRLVMHPAAPDRLYRQCYNGTYRSDDGALSWTEITDGLPSDFGYALVAHPQDPDTIYQIPESSSHLRAPVDGRLRVYRSNDAGASWTSVSTGLPAENVYVTVLREAMDVDGLAPCGVYFGTSGGHVFASATGGDHWDMAAGFLPRVLCVKAIAGTPE
jgi:hypothetical protein